MSCKNFPDSDRRLRTGLPTLAKLRYFYIFGNAIVLACATNRQYLTLPDASPRQAVVDTTRSGIIT